MPTNAACRRIDVEDEALGLRVPAWWLYPTTAATARVEFGPYTAEVAMDAPVKGNHLPLVVVSHGNGGSPWVHRGLAIHLVRAGFAVALVEHLGNSSRDNHLAGTAANLEQRPRHVHRAIDAAFDDPTLGPRLHADAVAIVGHSIGGYTALAVAGGQAMAFPEETADGQPRAIAAVHDPRVRALVLLAPATPWFGAPRALAGVTASILMLTGEHDTHAPAWHAEIVKSGVSDPSRVDHRVIAGAGHFSFQSPFPPEMQRPDFPPSQDPPGFDRAAFQTAMCEDVAVFLKRALSKG